MKIKHLATIAAFVMSMSSMAAHADLFIANNTDASATAYAGTSPCSNAAGDRGIIKPHGSVQIPDFLVGMYCTNNCKAQVFMSKNCSGKSIATVTANKKQGVIDIENHGIEGYQVVGSGKSISIEGGQSRKWYNWFF